MGCALVLIGSATAGTPAVPAEADEAIVVQASPWASAAAEARVLADRILQRESDDLLLDGTRQRTLGHEIKQALSFIQRTYPAMASITVRDAHSTATLLLGLEGALGDAVVGAWDGESASAPPRTGHAAFDALNATLGLKAVQPFPTLDSVVLHLGERANIAAAIRAYRAIGGVAYAEPDARLGDGDDIEAARVQGAGTSSFAGRGATAPPAASTRSSRSSPWRTERPNGSSPRRRAAWTPSRRSSSAESGANRILLIHESPLTDALFLLVSKSDEVTTT